MIQTEDIQSPAIDLKGVQNTISDSSINKIYVNGTIVAHSHTDMFIIGSLNAIPSVVVNIPFSAAKTLYQMLGESIKLFEAKAGIEIKTMDEMRILFEENKKKNND